MFAATALIFNGNGKILAVSRRNRHDQFCLIGGKAEEGELPTEAISREVLEEVGTEFTPISVIHSGPCSFDYLYVGSIGTACDVKIDTMPSGILLKVYFGKNENEFIVESKNNGAYIALNSREYLSDQLMCVKAQLDDIVVVSNKEGAVFRLPAARFSQMFKSMESYSMTFVGILHGEPKFLNQVHDECFVKWVDVSELYDGPFGSFNRKLIALYSQGNFKLREPTAREKLSPRQRHDGPQTAADCIIYKRSTNSFVAIERKHEPFGMALPGGHVDYGETFKEAAIREAGEEVSLFVDKILNIIDTERVFDEPNRDPRKHVITKPFIFEVADDFEPVAADDAKSFKWVNIWDKDKAGLILDHLEMVNILSEMLERENIGKCFLTEEE